MQEKEQRGEEARSPREKRGLAADGDESVVVVAVVVVVVTEMRQYPQSRWW